MRDAVAGSNRDFLTLALANGEVIEIDRAMVIGRAAEADISLDDPLVSSEHAQVEPGEGGVLVRDLDSGNGTMVDGARIASPTIAPVGARITVGLQLLTVRDRSTTGAVDVVPSSDQSSGVSKGDRSDAESDLVVVTTAAADDEFDRDEDAVSTGINPGPRRRFAGAAQTEVPLLLVVAIAAIVFALVAVAAFGVYRAIA